MSRFRLIVLLLCLYGPRQLYAGEKTGYSEVGSPLYKYFSAADFKANGQNFSIARGQSGIMYFANMAGVLQFDGNKWKTIPTTNMSGVTTLMADRNKTIWVGANGEFGNLSPDSSGNFSFHSFSEKLGQEVGYIREITESKHGISFISSQAIYTLKKDSISTLTLSESVEAAFRAGDKAFIFGKKTRKLLKWDGKEIISINYKLGASPPPLDLTGCIPLSSDSTLILTSNQGVYLCTGHTLEPLNWAVNRHRITSGTLLPGNTLAFGTHRAGMIITDRNGNIQQEESGQSLLQDNQINALIHDGDHHLWLALNDGISCYEWPSPISVYGKSNGLKGQITSILRFRETLYVGTLNGLFTIRNNVAIPVKGVESACLSLEICGGKLLAATNNGVLEIMDGAIRPITSELTLCLACSPNDNQSVFLGLPDGLAQLNVYTGKHTSVAGIQGQVSELLEDPSGDLWIETIHRGIYRYDTRNKNVKRYQDEDGLPANLYSRLSWVNGNVKAATRKGIYYHDKDNDRWYPDSALQTGSGRTTIWADRIVHDALGYSWASGGNKKGLTRFKIGVKEDSKTNEPTFYPGLADIPFEKLYTDKNGIIWAGGSQGLYRIDSRIPVSKEKEIPMLITTVSTENGVLRGQLTNIPLSLEQPLKAGKNKLNITFVAPSFNIHETVLYQYQLDNQQPQWSEWSGASEKEFSGLPPGSYVFRVRAKDIFGNVSPEATLSFVIKKPWYSRWWMVIIYTLLLGLFIHRLVRWRLRSVFREKQTLENLISERTEEIEDRKQELEQQSEALSATNDQLERIDSFVKAINAEVNTKNLFRIVLTRLCQFHNVDTSSAIMLDKSSGEYRFAGISGTVKMREVTGVTLTSEQVHKRYILHAREIYEDIFLQNNFGSKATDQSIASTFAPQSMVAIAIRTDGHIRSIITLENMTREEAFDEQDFQLFRGMKEHLAGAYIKTGILENLEETLHNLRSTQEALIRQERLASVGQLTKGIVDRILNPLNYINNFAQSSGFLVKDIEEFAEKEADAVTEEDEEDLDDVLKMLGNNLDKIYEHGSSATRIVKDMQKLLKAKSDQFLSVDIGSYLETRVNAVFQDILSEHSQSGVVLRYESSLQAVSKVSILPHEFSEVLQNLIGNSFYALTEKPLPGRQTPPLLKVSLSADSTGIVIRIRDNGKGIPVKEMEQLFSPFFTTKPTSKGTGLGLYMSKDIIEYHRGKISIESEEGQFTEVTIHLPKEETV